jgi:hypothetical protein
MNLLIHGRVRQKSEEHTWNLTEAVLIWAIHKLPEHSHVRLALNCIQALSQPLLELFLWLFIDKPSEKIPILFLLKIFLEIAENVIAIEQMDSMKLTVSL